MGEKLSIDDAQSELAELRAGRGGGGQSMYHPYLEEARDLNKGEVYTDTVEGYNRVSGLRNYLADKEPGNFEVKSAKEEGQDDVSQGEADYRVFIYRAEDVEE